MDSEKRLLAAFRRMTPLQRDELVESAEKRALRLCSPTQDIHDGQCSRAQAGKRQA